MTLALRALSAAILSLSIALFCTLPGFAQAPMSKAPSKGDPIGVEYALPEKNIVYMAGSGKWESAFEAITDALKNVSGYMTREGIKPSGDALVIYTSADDAGFEFQAAYPVAEAPKNPPKGDIAMGKSPTGKAYKFIHRGPYDQMDNTYEAITNFLDEKGIEAKDLFIEEYATDPTTTPPDQLVINVLVPIK